MRSSDEQVDPAEAVDVASNGAVTFAVHGPVATITLSRPDKLNAINSMMLRGLRAAIECAVGANSVRAVVILGEGRGFSAGGDLDEVSQIADDAAAFGNFLDEWHETMFKIEECPLPTVAGVHGFAFAGGLEITQVCDIVVIGNRTTLGDQHANYGLFPAGGSTQRLPRIVGARLATWMLLSGQSISPEAVASSGLVTEVVAEDAVAERAHEMASLLAAKSPAATAAIKKAIRRGRGLGVREAIAAERDIAVNHQGSHDARIGFDAFRARAIPDFARQQNED